MADLDSSITVLPRRATLWADAWRELLRSRAAVFGLIVIVVFVVTGLFGPAVAPHDPTRFGYNPNLPPAWTARGDALYPLGTDTLGRDVSSRLLFGTRTAMLIALTAAPLAAVIGAWIGLLAGYAGGRVDNMIMRLTDILAAFPAILFAVMVVLILRGTLFGKWLNGIPTLVLAFALIGWVGLARLVRSAVLMLKEEHFVEAARGSGASHARILFKHLLPNCLGLIIVWLTSAIPRVIILEALLGYIGIGITTSVEGQEFIVTSWGGLFFEGRNTIHSNPVLLLAPAVCVILVAVSFTFLGDRLRDALDPRLRGAD